MSIEALKEFTKVVIENEAYLEKAQKIGLNDIEGLIGFGKELGYEFSLEDVQELAKETVCQNEELSEDDLEQVSGGTATVGNPVARSAALAMAASSAASTPNPNYVVVAVGRPW